MFTDITPFLNRMYYQDRKALIEQELRKIKPEEYGPLAKSLFAELRKVKKKLNRQTS